MLFSYSRSNEIYQAFNENGTTYAYKNLDDEEEQFTTITKEFLDQIADSVSADINSYQKRITELEKYAAGNTEIINEILDWKELIEDKQYVISRCNCLADILENIEIIYSKPEEQYELICNID